MKYTYKETKINLQPGLLKSGIRDRLGAGASVGEVFSAFVETPTELLIQCHMRDRQKRNSSVSDHTFYEDIATLIDLI